MNIKKINLIISREFAIRVRKKSFIIATFLTPLMMAALITVPMIMSGVRDDREKVIEVIDPSGIGQAVLENQEYITFNFRQEGDLEAYRAGFEDKNLHAVCVLEDTGNNSVDIRLYSTGQIDSDVQRYISRQVSQEVERRKLNTYDIPQLQEIMQDVRTNIQAKTFTWTDTGDEKETIKEVYMAIAYLHL